MAATDWAVIVGICWYPGLKNLQGPLNDAEAFAEWALDKKGGDVPASNVRLILSSRTNPGFTSAALAVPVDQQVKSAFDELLAVSQANVAALAGKRVGRRLYLYFAGHGYEPSLHLYQLMAPYQTALLMANATTQQPGYHIGGRMYADAFFHSGYFDEIALFMDCCREVDKQSAPNPPHFNLGTDPTAIERVRSFYAWGTKWKGLSREKPIPSPAGPVRGVFTTTLLAGLRGAAAGPSGQVTSASLGTYLFESMKMYLTPQELEDPDIPKEPDTYPYPSGGSGLVFATVNPEQQVMVTPPAGCGAVVRGDRFRVVPPLAAGPATWEYRLSPGYYLAQAVQPATGIIPNQQEFEVRATGEIYHVQL